MSVSKCKCQCHTKVGHLACVTLQYIALQAADQIFTIVIVTWRLWLDWEKIQTLVIPWGIGPLNPCSVFVGGWRRLSFLILCLFVCWSVCLFVWFSIPILIPYNSLNNYQSNSLYKSQVYKKQECARGGRGNVNSKLVKFRQDLKKLSLILFHKKS